MPGPGCGNRLLTDICTRTDHHLSGKPRVRYCAHECLLRTCPECAGECPGGSHCPGHLPKPHQGGKWAHETALDAARRIERHLRGRPHQRVFQVVLSFPPGRYSETETDHLTVANRLRQTAERFLRAHPRKGAAPEDLTASWVVHLWRCERGHYTEWGPHVHGLTPAGADTQACEAYYRRTGNIVKVVNGKSGGFASYRKFRLFRHLVYELGHAAIIRGSPALTWSGSWREAREDEWGPEPEPDRPTCPECASPMERFDRYYSPLGTDLVLTADQGWCLRYLGTLGVTLVPVDLSPGPPAEAAWA